MATTTDEPTTTTQPAEYGIEARDVTETITVGMHMTPMDVISAMRSISKLTRALAARLMLNNGLQGGMANPIAQQIINCAAAADAAVMHMDPPKIMPAGRMPSQMGRA